MTGPFSHLKVIFFVVTDDMFCLFNSLRYSSGNEMLGPNNLVVPFIACGDLSGFDADQSYPLQTGYEYIEPRQKPINPQYSSAIKIAHDASKGETNS